MSSGRANHSKISAKQMKCIMFVCLLSPIIRLFPKSAVSFGDKAAWLSPIIAIPFVILLYALIGKYMKYRSEDDGLGEAIIRAIGRIPGKIVLACLAAWLIYYTGFVIRSSAERLLSSIYPNGKTGMFVLTMTIVALWIAMGKISGIARVSELFTRIIIVLLITVFASAMIDIDISKLLPVTVYQIDKIALGAIPIINVLSIGVYLLFLEGKTEKQNSKIKTIMLLTATIMLILITTIGTLGGKLIKSLQHSFFIMIRDIEILGVIERIEAVVIILWVVTDLIYISILMKICGVIIKTITDKKKEKKYITISGIISVVTIYLFKISAFEQHYLSGIIIPSINILITNIVIPLIVVIGIIKIKKGKKDEKRC